MPLRLSHHHGIDQAEVKGLVLNDQLGRPGAPAVKEARSMRMRTRTVALVALTSLSVLGARGFAVAGPLEGYNPKDDPNYTRALGNRAVRDEALLGLIGEFEGQQTTSPARPLPVSQAAPPQPQSYVSGDTRVASVSTGQPNYGPEYGFGAGYAPAFSYYGHTVWYPGWWQASPRIPWWSLLPFTRPIEPLTSVNVNVQTTAPGRVPRPRFR